MQKRTSDVVAAVLFALAAACSGGSSRSVPGTETSLSDAPEAAELEPIGEPPSAEALDALLARRAKRHAQGLVPDGTILHGTLREGARSDQLLVLRGGFCYRVLGVAGPDVKDMDLFLYDPNGVQTHQDPGQDRFPVLGMQSELCPSASGAYRLQAMMYQGGGPYAIGVYRTP